MSDLWFPGTDRSRPARVDGGSILGGEPKCLWHDTETSGVPSYSTDYWPNMTLDPRTGRTWQHIPADRAARALRNEAGGVQTNRWNVFQIEVIGRVNTIPFHPVMAEIAQWLHTVRGTPLQANVDWLAYVASYGPTRVRLSATAWSAYTGHLGHMHAPENDHGDPGWPFPIDQILTGAPPEEDDMPTPQEIQDAMVAALNEFVAPGGIIPGQDHWADFGRVLADREANILAEARKTNSLLAALGPRLDAIEELLAPPEPPPASTVQQVGP